MSTNYDELAARAERGDLAVKPGTVRRGASAAAEAQRLLMEATGTISVEDMTRTALGRPSLSAPGGSSPVVRARVPEALKNAVAAIAARDHRRESDIVREALAAYVESQPSLSAKKPGDSTGRLTGGTPGAAHSRR
jgi:hypothetical protein